MAVGQQVLSSVCDIGELAAASARVEASTSARSAAHAEQLRGVLAVDRVFTDAGMDLSAVAQVALLLRLSDRSAHVLLEQARLLGRLDGALEALEIGLWTVEQSRAFCAELDGRDPALQERVWTQLTAKLLADLTAGIVITRARLVEWLRRRVITADPADAEARRKAAQQHSADVEYRRRDDGLVDLFGLGLSAVNARAALSRIRARAGRFGVEDLRSVGQRRMEAFTDLLLGRDSLPLGPADDEDPFHQPETHCAAGCGCRLSEPVPCGVGVTLLVPLGAALGTTDELAELEGHGPIEPDLLAAVLANAPVIRAVHVDEHGVPLAVGERTVTPGRRDPVALRQALLDLAGSDPPGPLHPRHPDDHRRDGPSGAASSPDDRSVGGRSLDDAGRGDPLVDQSGRSDPRPGLTGPAELAATVDPPCPADDLDSTTSGTGQDDVRSGGVGGRCGRRHRAHPAGAPGPYRPGAGLRRLLLARSPRCEWPSCGAGAARCDLDHDVAHPDGPTCACNLGPLCRRHHRCKQQLLTKQRTAAGVVWTDPTGREWLSPSQHEPPATAVRPVPPLVEVDPDHDLPDDEDGSTDLDPLRLELRATDPLERTVDEQDDIDWQNEQRRVERLIHADGLGWGAALDDPTRWESHPAP